MARLGKWAKIWVEGYNLTTRSTNVVTEDIHDEVPNDAYTTDHRYLAGQADGNITLDGYLDDAAGSTHDALKTIANATSKLVTIALGNNATPAIGDPTASMDCQQMEYTNNPDLTAQMAINAVFKNRGSTYGLEWGLLLADATVTANGNQASVDNGASSANGGVGYLHILALSAGDTITVLIEDSPNNSDWTTLITFTLDGTALDAERLTVAGTVDQYVRVSYTVAGASISFPIAVAFKRN